VATLSRRFFKARDPLTHFPRCGKVRAGPGGGLAAVGGENLSVCDGKNHPAYGEKISAAARLKTKMCVRTSREKHKNTNRKKFLCPKNL